MDLLALGIIQPSHSIWFHSVFHGFGFSNITREIFSLCTRIRINVEHSVLKILVYKTPSKEGYCGVEKWLSHWSHNPEVVCSIHTSATIYGRKTSITRERNSLKYLKWEHVRSWAAQPAWRKTYSTKILQVPSHLWKRTRAVLHPTVSIKLLSLWILVGIYTTNLLPSSSG